jgi:esterase/lipase superfamily enzyme
MARVVMVGEVENSEAWEKLFRSHRDLFSTIYGQMGMNVIHFTTTDDNRFVLYSEPPDLDAWLGTLDSAEIRAAMAEDGVKRETVQIHVLDKELSF